VVGVCECVASELVCVVGVCECVASEFVGVCECVASEFVCVVGVCECVKGKFSCVLGVCGCVTGVSGNNECACVVCVLFVGVIRDSRNVCRRSGQSKFDRGTHVA
jgi:hypothetical protein